MVKNPDTPPKNIYLLVLFGLPIIKGRSTKYICVVAHVLGHFYCKYWEKNRPKALCHLFASIGTSNFSMSSGKNSNIRFYLLESRNPGTLEL